jgi:hypothetical protein
MVYSLSITSTNKVKQTNNVKVKYNSRAIPNADSNKGFINFIRRDHHAGFADSVGGACRGDGGDNDSH